jgi:hypothetical protein
VVKNSAPEVCSVSIVGLQSYSSSRALLPIFFCLLEAIKTTVAVLETECPSELRVTYQSREKLETSCYRIQKNREGFMIR